MRNGVERSGRSLSNEAFDGDLMGDAVNIAARLEGVAKPGAICLSEQAYWQVKGRLDLKVTDLGNTQLKNIAEPIHVYSLEVGQPTGARPASAASPGKPGPPRLSLVVLPFANIGGDPEQQYFAYGVTESLTTDLSRISGAFVIARNTAFTYKGKAADVKQIGRDLNVRYVLDSDRWWLPCQDSLISQWFIRHPLPSLSLREAAGKRRAVFRGKNSTRQLVERSPRGPRIPVIRKITASSVFVTP